jgi:GTPase Era involved in 16S rRNA processing
LTHLDTVPKAAANSWKKAYETLGAERWDDAPLNTQVANQARQAQDLRNQYNIADAPVTTKPKKNKSYFESQNKKQLSAITPVEEVLFVNAKQGQGIHALHRAIFKAGAHVQERRERRGLNPRALRVGIIGYPNVGKVRVVLYMKRRVSVVSSSDIFYPLKNFSQR